MNLKFSLSKIIVVITEDWRFLGFDWTETISNVIDIKNAKVSSQLSYCSAPLLSFTILIWPSGGLFGLIFCWQGILSAITSSQFHSEHSPNRSHSMQNEFPPYVTDSAGLCDKRLLDSVTHVAATEQPVAYSLLSLNISFPNSWL